MKIYNYNGKANVSGDRIHRARTAQRLSQDALAVKMQVEGVGIARVLNVSLEWLTGDIE